MDINIKALAKQIAIELKKRDAFVMSATDIALFFGFAPTSASLRRLLADSTFPQPTSLTPNGFRCWKRDDVIENSKPAAALPWRRTEHGRNTNSPPATSH